MSLGALGSAVGAAVGAAVGVPAGAADGAVAPLDGLALGGLALAGLDGLALAALDWRTLAADASLLLLVGGLSMMGLIMALVVLQSLFPDKPRPAGGAAGPIPRQLRPLREAAPLFAERDRKPKHGFRPEYRTLPVDRALGKVVELQLGEPRLLRTMRGASRVRLYGCRGCEPGKGEPQAGCTYERQAMQRAFRSQVAGAASVREVRCRGRGATACEFEVRH